MSTEYVLIKTEKAYLSFDEHSGKLALSVLAESGDYILISRELSKKEVYDLAIKILYPATYVLIADDIEEKEVCEIIIRLEKLRNAEKPKL